VSPLHRGLSGIRDESMHIWPSPATFVLLRTTLPGTPRPALRLRRRGPALRCAALRCAAFSGLDDSYARLAVPLAAESRELLAAPDQMTFAMCAQIMHSERHGP